MGVGSAFYAGKPFQHSAEADARYEASGYTSVVERRDCCARCANMTMRGRNPYCNLHRIHVQKFGVCASRKD